MSESPETDRLDPAVPHEGVEFERMPDGVFPTAVCIVPVDVVEADAWQDWWRRWLTGQGRRPMGDPSLRFAAYVDVRDPQTGENLWTDPDDDRDGYFAEGPVDAPPAVSGV